MIPFSLGHADILRQHQGSLIDTATYCERFPCRNPDAESFDAQITEMCPVWQRCQRRHHRMRIQNRGGISPDLLLARSCYLNLFNLSGTWCLGLLAKSTQTICLNWLLGQVGFNYYTTRQFRHFKPLLCFSKVCPDLPSFSSLSIEDCNVTTSSSCTGVSLWNWPASSRLAHISACSAFVDQLKEDRPKISVRFFAPFHIRVSLLS